MTDNVLFMGTECWDGDFSNTFSDSDSCHVLLSRRQKERVAEVGEEDDDHEGKTAENHHHHPSLYSCPRETGTRAGESASEKHGKKAEFLKWVKMMSAHRSVSLSTSSRHHKLISLFFCLVFMSQLFVDRVTCAPIRYSTSPSSLQHYLLKFGYLPQSGFEIRDQVTEERMREAISELQAFANITITGVLDEDTKRLMRKPRCGNPDYLAGQFRSRRKRFALQGQSWNTTYLTWSLKKPSRSPDTHVKDIEREVRHALKVWSTSTPLTFQELTRDRADEAQIRIIFERGRHDDGYPFDGKGSILAHAFFPGTGHGGDAHFDDDEIWLTNGSRTSREGTRLFAVAAHEFGHSLGLSHSDVEGALMYPWYQSFEYNLTLHRDDELGITQIYGSKLHGRKNPSINVPAIPNPRPNMPSDPTTKSPRTRHPTNKPHYDHEDGRPNTCDSTYDAISLIRKELFIFKGRYFWRIHDNQVLNKSHPQEITRMWRGLPEHLSHIDAVYEHSNGNEIIFFIGKYFWEFTGTDLKRGKVSLTELGISPDVEKIDGAMIWGHNGKTYIFSGSKYWRLDDTRPDYFRVEPDYPRDMYVWKGVPYNIDSVLKWKDNKVYFFKGKVFWRFDDRHMRVASETPSLSAPFWMGCTSDPIPRQNEKDLPTSSSPPSAPRQLSLRTCQSLVVSLVALLHLFKPHNFFTHLM